MKNVYGVGDLVRIVDADRIQLTNNYGIETGDIVRVTEGNKHVHGKGIRILKDGDTRTGIQGLYVYSAELQFLEPAKKSLYVVEVEETLTYLVEVEAVDAEEAQEKALVGEDKLESSEGVDKFTRVMSVLPVEKYRVVETLDAYVYSVVNSEGLAIAGMDDKKQAEAYAKFLEEAEK